MNVDTIFIVPPKVENADSDGDSGDEDGGGLVDNLSRNLLQAESVAVLSNGRMIGEEEIGEEAGDEEIQEECVGGTGKNNKKLAQKNVLDYKWGKKPVSLAENIPEWKPSTPKKDLRDLNSPIEVFEYFVDDELFQILRTETNRYATQQGNSSFSVSVAELRIVLGILIISGYHSLPSRNHYWSLQPDLMVDIVGRAMPRNRFDEILRYLHVANSLRLDKDDRMAKLRPMMDHLQDRFQSAYVPEQHLSFDESMVAYYGRHSCKQFIRGKPIRFGFKNFCLCTPLGYLIAFDTYQGKTYRGKEYDEFGKGGASLLNILDSLKFGLEKLHTTIYCDNYFTGCPLIAELGRRGKGLVGTIRENRIPKNSLLNTSQVMKKGPRGDHKTVYDSLNKMALCRWKDNAVVTLASNVVADKPMQKANRWSAAEKKKITVNQPMIVKQYNSYMGGVDRLDQDVNCYRIGLRKKKWWFSLFTWMLDATISNAYYYFKVNHPNISFLDFRRRLVLCYLQGCQPIPPRPGPSRDRSLTSSRVIDDVRFDEREHFVILTGKQQKCAACPARPLSACRKCNVNLCVKCFFKFHSP